jgi:DNA-binding NarL/FixJ family response regulator
MELIRVLLADDHALMRAGLREALNNLTGLEVVGETGNGRDLMQALDSLHPDLLVMDVNMPDFEPISAVREMRAAHPDLKILVVSAYGDQAYVLGLLSAGVNGYHLKDQPISDFDLAVRRVLDGGRWISDPLVNQLVSQQIAPKPSALTLTRRQKELLYLLNQGHNNNSIARTLNLSIKTVEAHLTALYRIINVEGRLEANIFASHHPEVLSDPQQDKNSQGTPVGRELTVLLVDNNRRYRAQLASLVRRACPSCELYEADDAAEAYHFAERVKPRLAFIDVVLDGDDGIECLKRIKNISARTSIILISAYPDWGFRQAGKNAGAVAYLDKADIDELAIQQVVEDVLAI